MHVEASGGLVLLAAVIAALIWVNSPWADSYEELWRTHFSFDLAILAISEDLRHLINDGLMTTFFFLVGLEIKRELAHGELSSPRRAVLPAMAALGGMIVPAIIYASLNLGGEGEDGWAIPMATDIAFAVGVLSLLGKRVPLGARVFLLALAIVDDIGAILVIAIFYSQAIDLMALAVAAGILGAIIVMNRAGMRNVDIYAGAGVILWLALFESGIHATLTGVVLGLLAPASYFYAPASFSAAARELIRRFEEALASGNVDEQQGLLSQMEDLSHGTEAPLDRLERQLHPWVSFVVVPLFALANAGLVLDSNLFEAASASSITAGIGVALLIGKPLGIASFTWLAVRLRLGELPAGVAWSHIIGIGLLGGIGFTVSLLISDLSFATGAIADQARAGIFGASLLAALSGFVFLYITTRRTT